MRQFNVEIFKRDFSFVSHTNVSNVSYAEDYLSPVTNEITVLNCEASKGDYIRIQDAEDDFFGIITAVSSQDARTMTIQYGSFLSIFDTDLLFDTDLQGTSNLETVLKNLITGMFVSNPDTVQNIPGLSVETAGSTTNWGFNLKSDTEGKHHCIINFYSVLIARALEKYSVVITVTPDVQNKAIVLTIGAIQESPKVIEADLPNIVVKNVVIKETDKDVNKLTVYNTENYTDVRTYYRHSDDTYSTANTDRITPVVQEIHGVAPAQDGTFENAADSDAANVFGGISYNNLIELTVTNGDTLIKPYALDIGQVVNIISKGNVYTSILTGKAVSDSTQLTFGTIRLDLTKIIKRRYGGKWQ